MEEWRQDGLQWRLNQRLLDLEWSTTLAQYKQDNDKQALLSRVDDLANIISCSGSSRADDLHELTEFKHNYIFTAGDETVLRVESFLEHSHI